MNQDDLISVSLSVKIKPRPPLHTISMDLSSIPLFATLPTAMLEVLHRDMRVRSYPKHAVIVNQGDQALALFVVQSGTLKVVINEEQNREFVLSTLQAGDYFGELSLLDEAPRSASVVALENCQLLVLSRQTFLSTLESNPEFMRAAIVSLVKRVRSLTESVCTLALVDVFGRIVRLLNSLAVEQTGRLVAPRLSQQEIANRVGASREMISRIFKDLVIGGYLVIEPEAIIIAKKLPGRW